MRRVLFVFALSICSLVAWAYDFSAVAPSGQTLYYTLTSRFTVEVSGSTNLTGSLTIPSTVDDGNSTYYVTSIGDSAFYNCSELTNVTISNSVTHIGHRAFRGCSGLTTINIPNSVSSLGASAFSGCSSLTTVVIPSSVTSISEAAFYECSGLTSITIPNSVTSIEKSAFFKCSSLTDVTIPNSVTFLGDYAFDRCSSLQHITIPDSVTSIGNYVFYGCVSLTSANIGNSVTSLGHTTFAYCYSLTTLTIGSGLTTINEYAFCDCDHLDTIICNAVTPPTVADTNAFTGVWKGLALIVPGESVGQYQSAYCWQDFFNIIGSSVGIEDLNNEYKVFASNGAIVVSGAEGQALRIYDVQGRLIVSEKAADNKLYDVPTTGVYVVQVGKHRAQKVVVGR